MRLTFNAEHQNALADLRRIAADMMRWQHQVSSGRRVNTPSDDPPAAARIVLDRASLASVAQYDRAVDMASSRLMVADTVLGDLVARISAARTEAASAIGSVPTDSQREAAAMALEGLRDAILSDINTTFRGTYLFSGTATTSPPYERDAGGTVSSYRGNGVSARLDVDRERSVPLTFDGEAIIKGAGAEDLFQDLDSLVAAIRANHQDGIEAGMDALQGAFDRAVSAQTVVGTQLAQLDDHKLRLASSARAASSRLSSDQDANAVEALTGLSQSETAYRAALAAMSNRSRASLFDYLK